MRDQSIIVLPHVYFHLFFFVKVSTSFKLNRSNWRNRVTNEYTRASHKCQPECQTCRAVWRAQSLRQSPSRPLLYPYAIHSRGYHRIRHGSRSLRDFRVFLDFSDRPGSCTPARPNGNYSLTFLSPICRKAVSYSLLILGAATFGVAVTYPEQVVWAYTAASRASRIICMSILVAIDYKWSLRKSLLADLRNADEIDGADRVGDVYSMVHRRSAERMLDVFQRNGGVYIKLGQHMNALVYLLPFEYTDTFEVLQDQCPPTAMKDIRKLIKDETGLELDDLFENFEEKPIGVASLAQVHRATLKSNQRPVAIKLQHPQLQAHAPIDTALCTSVIRIIKSVFPDFELSWLADEMAVTLPQELDFGMEAANLATVRGNFRGDPVFFVPGVFWSTKRILVEEFVYGVKVDDLEGLRMHDIEPLDVSEVLSRVFSKMLFWDGFVHCDPHPGNIIIRPRQRNWYEVPFLRKCLGLNPYNFDLILLDHGLYRSIPSSLRLDFCHLWTSLIRFDESKMKHYAARIFEMPSGHHTPGQVQLMERMKQIDPSIDPHRLFASMLTGRPWSVIAQHAKKNPATDTSSPVDKLASDITGDTSTGLASLRSLDEKTTVINKLNKRKFLSAITNIMAVLPREVLLIIKTNDILRSVDRRLGVTGGPALKNEVGNATEGDEERMEVVGKRMVRRFAWMVYYCSVAIRNERMRGAHTLREITEAWLDSWGILARILIMEMVTSN